METLTRIARELKRARYPIRGLGINQQGWVEAEFKTAGVTVTLALPAERASSLEFADLYDKAVGAKEAD
jgi:hypothetical protein